MFVKKKYDNVYFVAACCFLFGKFADISDRNFISFVEKITKIIKIYTIFRYGDERYDARDGYFISYGLVIFTNLENYYYKNIKHRLDGVKYEVRNAGYPK